jgi:hypothetical protein
MSEPTIVAVDEPIIARAVTWFGYRRVYVGDKFHDLPDSHKLAALSHEFGHCAGHHTEWRALALFFPFIIKWLCHWQEYRADAYAAERGHGPALLQILRNETPGDTFHPANSLRRKKLVHNKFFARPPLRATAIGVTNLES